MNFARMSLFEPEVVFCERPLGDITPDTRGLVQAWLGQVVESGGIVITAGEPLREALLMPGTAFYEEDGCFHQAQTDEGEAGSNAPEYAGDEVRVFKVPAKSGDATSTWLMSSRRGDVRRERESRELRERARRALPRADDA